jgi:hypothetical protein
VACEFNGIDVVARPNDRPSDLVKRYWSTVNAREQANCEENIQVMVDAIMACGADREQVLAVCRRYVRGPQC